MTKWRTSSKFRKSECDGKQRYDEWHAYSQARHMTRTTGVKFRAYKCRFCRKWHVAHAQSKARRLGG